MSALRLRPSEPTQARPEAAHRDALPRPVLDLLRPAPRRDRGRPPDQVREPHVAGGVWAGARRDRARGGYEGARGEGEREGEMGVWEAVCGRVWAAVCEKGLLFEAFEEGGGEGCVAGGVRWGCGRVLASGEPRSAVAYYMIGMRPIRSCYAYSDLGWLGSDR